MSRHQIAFLLIALMIAAAIALIAYTRYHSYPRADARARAKDKAAYKKRISDVDQS
jgi:Tfp pilus assembly protein PilE